MVTARRRKLVACAADAPLPPAAVRLYARALEIENEIEEAVADGDYMTNEELLAWSERSRQGTLDIDAKEAATKARSLKASRVSMDEARARPAARARSRGHQPARAQ